MGSATLSRRPGLLDASSLTCVQDDGRPAFVWTATAEDMTGDESFGIYVPVRAETLHTRVHACCAAELLTQPRAGRPHST